MSRQTANVLIAVPVILLISAAPLLSMWLATMIAAALGCQLDEGNVHPCVWHGIDLGNALYQMFVIAWLGIATLPFGVIAILTLFVVWIAAVILRRLRGQRPEAKG